MNKKFVSGDGFAPTASPTKATKPRAKPTPTKTNVRSTPTSKRKRNVTAHASDEDSAIEEVSAVTDKEVEHLNRDLSLEESPSKRSRTMMKYEVDDDEGAQMSGSEFDANELV